jgi:nitrogen regulatory protein PII
VIVGAWALAFHGRPRYTGDLDIFVSRDEDNADKLMTVIEAFGFGAAGISHEDFLQPDYVIQLGRAPNRIDILTGISGVTFEDAWKSREQGKIGDAAVFVISRELLIENKRAANRDKDLADIKLLEKTRPKKS